MIQITASESTACLVSQTFAGTRLWIAQKDAVNITAIRKKTRA
ncbi:MAG: hypothetical protein Q8N77_02720 [Nanoarchaeota archaeon]|nr:hypothetical protein [Nanoarchaeota archaeon]